jgi:RNA polymerase sigma factor (TIGR02999 family)
MNVTLLLCKAGSGDKQALDEVMPLVYEELRRLGNAQLRNQGDVTRNATALVHEAFQRLVGRAQPAYENRSHFYGIASRLMRHLLVDVIRNRRALKRGHGKTVSLERMEELGEERPELFFAFERCAGSTGGTAACTGSWRGQVIDWPD